MSKNPPKQKIIVIKNIGNQIRLHELAERYSEYSDASIATGAVNSMDYHYMSGGLVITYTREETDEEQKKRSDYLEDVDAKTKIKNEQKKEDARKEFDRLKQTYGFE